MTKKQKEYSERLKKAKNDLNYDEIAKIELEILDEMNKIDKEIALLEKDIGEKRKQIKAIEERRDKKAKKEEEKLPIIKKEYENEVWQYLCAKVRADRKNGVIAKNNQLDDDDTLLSLSNQKEKSTIDIQNTIKELTDEAKVEIETIEKSIKPMEAKLGRKNAESSFYWDLIKPPKSSSDESTVSVYSSTPSYTDDSACSYSGTSSHYSNTSTSDDSRAFEDALKRDREARWEHDREEEKRRQREYDQRQKEEDRRRREDERRQQEEARKQAELARKQAEREEYARRMEVDRQRRQQEEAARREAHRIRYYHGIVYFKNGTTRRTGSTNVRQNAERMAADLYNQAMRTAVSDYSKPTRYEVVEDYS